MKGIIYIPTIQTAKLTLILGLNTRACSILFMYYFALNCTTFADTVNFIHVSSSFTIQLISQRGEQLLSALTLQTRRPLLPSCSLCTLVIPPFQMTMTYWVFGPEVVANLTLGPHYFLKHVPTLKWLVCAKNAAEQGDSSLCEGRDGQRGVEKQLRCWLLTIKTFPSTNRAFI